jgi:hypothetical protein
MVDATPSMTRFGFSANPVFYAALSGTCMEFSADIHMGCVSILSKGSVLLPTSRPARFHHSLFMFPKE